MLVKVVAFECKHKLADTSRWVHDSCVVVKQPNDDIPVFTVRKENGTGRLKTLHRNIMLPVGIIRDKPMPVPRKPPKQISATRKLRKTKEPEYYTHAVILKRN